MSASCLVGRVLALALATAFKGCATTLLSPSSRVSHSLATGWLIAPSRSSPGPHTSRSSPPMLYQSVSGEGCRFTLQWWYKEEMVPECVASSLSMCLHHMCSDCTKIVHLLFHLPEETECKILILSRPIGWLIRLVSILRFLQPTCTSDLKQDVDAIYCQWFL